ncbi:hypothetical protein ACFQNE_01945 [Gordonia phosphorivorans]|uniref:Exonuclease domain-containing protein n=1 Tax=Gordonia phosphorivorans TaxID=1056982 RepID=A0ABV6H6J7_9ACTN
MKHLTDTDNAPAKFVVIDVETSRLTGPGRLMVEAALLVLDETLTVTERLSFVPYHDVASMVLDADPEALAVNRYFERRLFSDILPSAESLAVAERLRYDVLAGATLVGANTAFDQSVLWDWLRSNTWPATRGTDSTPDSDPDQPPWHFRLWDVQAATAALHGLATPPSLSECCDLWGFDRNPDLAHTALGDAEITAQVFKQIRAAGTKVTNIHTTTEAPPVELKRARYVFGANRR